MKRLNNYGMTAVEMLVSFVIVVVIVVGMFDVIMNYKNKQQIESIENSVIAYSNSLQKTIQDDMVKGHLTSVVANDTDKSAVFEFDRPSTYQTGLTISCDRNSIQYGTMDQPITYPLPEIPDLKLSTESKVEVISAEYSFLKITIVLEHPNFKNERYTFTIVTPINFVESI